jgi:hypothetical protein
MYFEGLPRSSCFYSSPGAGPASSSVTCSITRSCMHLIDPGCWPRPSLGHMIYNTLCPIFCAQNWTRRLMCGYRLCKSHCLCIRLVLWSSWILVCLMTVLTRLMQDRAPLSMARGVYYYPWSKEGHSTPAIAVWLLLAHVHRITLWLW